MKKRTGIIIAAAVILCIAAATVPNIFRDGISVFKILKLNPGTVVVEGSDTIDISPAAGTGLLKVNDIFKLNTTITRTDTGQNIVINNYNKNTGVFQVQLNHYRNGVVKNNVFWTLRDSAYGTSYAAPSMRLALLSDFSDNIFNWDSTGYWLSGTIPDTSLLSVNHFVTKGYLLNKLNGVGSYNFTNGLVNESGTIGIGNWENAPLRAILAKGSDNYVSYDTRLKYFGAGFGTVRGISFTDSTDEFDNPKVAISTVGELHMLMLRGDGGIVADDLFVTDSLILQNLNSPTEYGWLYLDSASHAVGVDSMAVASFGLEMKLPLIDLQVTDKKNREIKWFWKDSAGNICQRYGIGGRPSEIIEQLTAATELQYRYIYRLTWHIRIMYLIIIIFIIIKKKRK
jgi:hypothetical protein